MLHRGLTITDTTEIETVRADAVEAGARLYIVTAPDEPSGPAFFQVMRATLPMIPPVRNYGFWDALVDSLRSGFDEVAEDQIVILLEGFLQLKTLDPRGYADISETLQDVAEDLADPEHFDGRIKDLCCYIT